MICDECEMLSEAEPIKVITYKSLSPFADNIIHFRKGYKCLYTGMESLNKEDLPKHNCRLIK